MAWAGLNDALIQRVLAAVRRFIPSFDPTRLTTPIDVNECYRAVYLEGRVASAPLREAARGAVDARALQLASVIAGLRYSFMCPLKVLGQIEGQLSFHTRHIMSHAQRLSCDAFTRQAALTIENRILQDVLRAEVSSLKDSELKYRTLVDVSPEAIVTIDKDSKIQFVNRAAEALFGYSVQEMTGKPLTMLMPPDLAPAHL